MAKANILLVEDDRNMAFLIHENLKAGEYGVKICNDGESALKHFRQEDYSLCILDVMLPKMDGFTLARAIRKVNERIPVIFLTARNMIQDKEAGFSLGADDYITKPFNIRELLLRIEAILKRTGNGGDAKSFEEKTMGIYRFNYMTRQLKTDHKVHKLSGKEAELLQIFLENRNRLLPRQTILRSVWGDDNFFTAKSMDVYLTRIRKLIKGDPNVELQNVHGIGYKFIVRD